MATAATAAIDGTSSTSATVAGSWGSSAAGASTDSACTASTACGASTTSSRTVAAAASAATSAGAALMSCSRSKAAISSSRFWPGRNRWSRAFVWLAAAAARCATSSGAGVTPGSTARLGAGTSGAAAASTAGLASGRSVRSAAGSPATSPDIGSIVSGARIASWMPMTAPAANSGAIASATSASGAIASGVERSGPGSTGASAKPPSDARRVAISTGSILAPSSRIVSGVVEVVGSAASASCIRSDVGQAIGPGSSAGAWPFAPFAPLTPLGPCAPLAPFEPLSARSPALRSRSGNGAGRISCPRCGVQERQLPSASFQQLPHVYWRHVMQKLNVLWKASSWNEVSSRSVSLRAAAIASSIDESSDRTKFFRPRERTLMPFRRAPLGAADSNV